MSMESAVAFYEKLEGDLEFAKSFEGKAVEEVERLVKGELGYDFTKEEMQKVIFERNPEMTDEELEAVVGGLSGSVIKQGLLVGAVGVVAVGGLAGAVVVFGAAGAAA